jgi:hypothetical protein
MTISIESLTPWSGLSTTISSKFGVLFSVSRLAVVPLLELKPPSELPLAQGTSDQAAQTGVRKSVDEPAKGNHHVAGIINVLERPANTISTASSSLPRRQFTRNPNIFPTTGSTNFAARCLEARDRAVRPRLQRNLRSLDSQNTVFHRLRSPDASEHGDDELRLPVSS